MTSSQLFGMSNMRVWGNITFAIEWTISNTLESSQIGSYCRGIYGPLQLLTPLEITPSYIISERYPSLQDLTTPLIPNQQTWTPIVDSTLQSSLEGLCVEDQMKLTRQVSEEQPSQTMVLYLLPSPHTPHTPAQQRDEQPRIDSANSRAISKTQYSKPKISTYTELQNQLHKLGQFWYLEAHILDIYATSKNLLQADQPHTLFQIDNFFINC